tara:strand:- start:1159 stop:1740 length:582 start_codon:yes stop_codon:yes gene_type:complete
MKRIVLIGDSIRMGYEPTVVRQLEGWAEVVEMGKTQGGTTRNVLEHLDEWAIGQNFDIVHINAGLHDMARAPGPGPENRVPLDEYSQNLREILGRLLGETEAKVIFALTTPVDLGRQHAVDYGINRTDEDVLAYNEAATGVAEELCVGIDDLYQVVMDNGKDEMLGPDGVHFTEQGAEVLGRAVAAVIRGQGE